MADHSTSTIIINLNHFAIKAMNDSGYMEACGLLSEALILLDKSTSLSPVGMSLSELLMREVSPIGSPSTLFGMYSMTPRVSSDQNLGIDSIVSTSLPIRRAVQITGSEKRRDHLNTIVYDYSFLLDGVVSKDLWKAILLYNNGLSLHLHGLERGDNELLRQALLLYQTVYSTIIHESRSSVGLIGICTSQQILPRFQSDLLILLASVCGHDDCTLLTDSKQVELYSPTDCFSNIGYLGFVSQYGSDSRRVLECN